MCNSVDVAIIGAGPAGTEAAIKLAGGNFSVALIEQSKIGGTCLNVGCIPSKSWLAAAHAYNNPLAKKLGLPTATANMDKISDHAENVISIMSKGLTATLKTAGVQLINGSASFLSANALSITGEHNKELCFKYCIIATGGEPIAPFGTGSLLHTTNSIFSLRQLPSSITIIGGGVVGIEMASFFRSIGSAVTIIEALDNILYMMDEELRNTIKREFKKQKISIKTGIKVKSVTQKDGKVTTLLENSEEVTSDILLTAIGRRPCSKNLQLEKAGITIETNGAVKTDQNFTTSAQNIFAVGDIAGKSNLAYLAEQEATAAATTIAAILNKQPPPKPAAKTTPPYIVFSNPEAAWIGKTEQQLQKEGTEYKKGVCHLRTLAKAHATAEIAGLVKLLFNTDGKIIAAHMAGIGATEMVHTVAMAIETGMTAKQLSATTFGHPTISEAIKLASQRLEAF